MALSVDGKRQRVAVLATLDTKGPECAYLRKLLGDLGLDVVTVDVGIRGEARATSDVSADEVLAAIGVDRRTLVERGDRGEAITTMGRAARVVLERLRGEGVVGAIALGGSGNASIAAEAFGALPLGIPKMLISTVVSGDTRPFVHGRDLTLVYPIVDIAGINRVSAAVLHNAAHAFAGMVRGLTTVRGGQAPLITATMFGVTTPCVDTARALLEARGYEVLVFHATGEGGRSMEILINTQAVDGVLDVTLSELTDELLGGIASAGPHRLEAAGRLAVPQVVAPGAVDIANFGPIDTVPERYAARLLHMHNSATTLMRINEQESAEVGRRLADKINAAIGPVTLFIPLRGLSELDAPGQVFAAPAADEALFDSLRAHLASHIEVVWMDVHINDPAFGRAMADRLSEMVRNRK